MKKVEFYFGLVCSLESDNSHSEATLGTFRVLLELDIKRRMADLLEVASESKPEVKPKGFGLKEL
jgi:hypothetical protein